MAAEAKIIHLRRYCTPAAVLQVQANLNVLDVLLHYTVAH